MWYEPTILNEVETLHGFSLVQNTLAGDRWGVLGRGTVRLTWDQFLSEFTMNEQSFTSVPCHEADVGKAAGERGP